MIQLSIIIPTYNSVESLIKLLDTIDFSKNLEVIVVDDYSDYYFEMEEILSDYNSRVTLLRNRLNKGAGVCRSIGLKHAKGKWILFADADDLFINDFFNILTKHFDSTADVIYFVPTSLNLNSNNLSKRHLRYSSMIEDYLASPTLKNELRLKYRFYVPWSKMYQKEFIELNNITFDDTLVSNDVMFAAKIGYYSKKIEVTDEIIYCVTESNDSLTKKTDINRFKIRRSVYIKYVNFLRENITDDEFKLLNINGTSFIVQIFKHKLNIWLVFDTIKLFRKENIRVLNIRHANILRSIYNFRKRVRE